MTAEILLAAAVVLQLSAAILAIRLIWVTGARLAWGLVATAILLMVARRFVPLYRLITNDPSFSADPAFEAVGLAISACMAAGIAGIGPFFRAMRRSAESAVEHLRSDLALHEQAERREAHLGAVLRAIRNVNQHITREKNLQELLDAVCSCLVETRGYRLAWVASLDDSRRLRASAEAGVGAWFASFQDKLRRGDFAPCVEQALTHSGVTVLDDGAAMCDDCPLGKCSGAGQVLTARLAVGQRVHGVLTATVDPLVAIDEEERALFEELAGDVAFAIESMRLESEHVRMEQELRRSEEHVRLLLESIRDYAVFMLDPQGSLMSWNVGAERIKGYRSAEIVGQHFSRFYTPEDIALGKPAEQLRICAEEGRLEDEGWRVRKDGSRFWANAIITAVRDEAGSLRGFAKVTRDVTERKQAEKVLKLNESRLETLLRLNQMTEASFQEITDFALEEAVRLTESTIGYLAFLNEDESVLTMHSWSKTAMAACAIIDKPIVYPVVTTGLWGEAVRQRKPVLTNDYAAPNPLKKGHPEGHVRVLRHMNLPIFDGERIVVVAGVGNKEAPYDASDVRQLTLLMQGMWQLVQRKRIQEDLRKSHDELELRVRERTAELVATNEDLRAAIQAAEVASRAKSTFLANMSHEIRTPLNAVIGMTELVLKSPLSPQQREFLATVKDSGEALLSVINDVLDFSKIEAGKLTLDRATFDLRENVGDTMKSFALRAHQQGLELACFIHHEVPHMVAGDYGRLRQIIVNLVGNAIKFTEKGEVTLEVTQESRSEKDATLHFTVADTGIGIPPEKQTAIFEMFEQADASTTRRHGGTGLGLAIALRLVNLMGGRLWVESQVGRGSRFHFVVRLDLAESEPAEPQPPEPASLHGMRVLVVDDNATNRRILDEVLRSWQMLPATTAGASEAIRSMLEAKQDSQPYRLVLTDAHMPTVDGFALAEHIRDNPALEGTVVMMLTSGDRPEDTKRCEELGIAAYLLKPIKQSELLEAIELALGIVIPGKTRLASAAPPPHVKRLQILLAEDSLVNQKLAVAILEEEGHSVTVAANGKEALAATRSKQFDLILMDVQMPEMDGLEATAEIREREKQTGTHVSIIAMTARALKGDRDRCLEAGMDDYVAKPIHADELLQTIAALFDCSATAPQRADLPSHCDAVDWAEALRAVRGNEKLMRDVVELALKEIPTRMTEIRSAVAEGNAARLQLSAHTLKGILRYFGPSPAFEHAARLERIGDGHCPAEASSELIALEATIAAITDALLSHLRGIRG